MSKKVMVAMSGGVDSSVAAYLLKSGGSDICGATLKLFSNEDIEINSKTCCSLNDIEDAGSVCRKIGIEHFVFNFKDIFKKQVIDRFVHSYHNGETPNPCIDCNKYIKLDALLKRAGLLGWDYIATGHYAVIEAGSRFLLKKARDITKDQSYVLYSFTQEQLSKTILPLGNLSKNDVREIAHENGLITAKKHDSQDICFVPDGRYNEFIERYTGSKICSGDILDINGKVLGRHEGIECYTIGQRKGIGISFNKPMYVCRKNAASNTIILGEEKDLYSKSLTANDVNFIAVDKLSSPLKAKAKIRYNSKEQPALIHQISESEIFVEFETAQRAITKGQAIVFYDGDVVIGGGTIG